MDLQELSDRQEITDLMTRYTLALDTRSFTDLREVFTADAVLDYASAGGPTGDSEVAVPWLERGLSAFDRSQHVIGQIAVDLSENAAQALAYFTSQRVRVNPDGTERLIEVGGYYHLDLVRTPDGWRSRGFVEDRVWSRRN